VQLLSKVTENKTCVQYVSCANLISET